MTYDEVRKLGAGRVLYAAQGGIVRLVQTVRVYAEDVKGPPIAVTFLDEPNLGGMLHVYPRDLFNSRPDAEAANYIDLIKPQPKPVANQSRPVWDLVREDCTKYMIQCRVCGAEFGSNASAARYCSDKCYYMGHVEPTSASSCWLWKGKCDPYGHVERRRGEQESAHVFAYRLFWGEVPAELVVRHTCNVPACVNPFHLLVGTPAQNSADMVESQRQAVGELHGQSKLTVEQVLEIRADAATSHSELARRYGVTHKTISSIRLRKTWQRVDDDMRARDQEGRRKYGTPLQAGNGRDALTDAYQEALDLAVYLRQAIEERKAEVNPLFAIKAELLDRTRSCERQIEEAKAARAARSQTNSAYGVSLGQLLGNLQALKEFAQVIDRLEKGQANAP